MKALFLFVTLFTINAVIYYYCCFMLMVGFDIGIVIGFILLIVIAIWPDRSWQKIR